LCIGAEKTSIIEIGTAVTPTFLRHPIAMAQQALTLQTIASGRFSLGIGVNHKPIVESRFGMNFHKPVRHIQEYIQILRALSMDGEVNYKGEIFSAQTQFTMKDRLNIPILLAALGPKMLKTAGEMAEGTITWMTGSETVRTHTVPLINQAAEAAGRDSPRVVVSIPLALTDDKESGFRIAADYFKKYGQLPSYRAMLNKEGVESPAELAVVGNEEEVESKLIEYADAGATDIAVQIYPVGPDPENSVNRSREFLRTLVGKI
jgi:5,10-methylenetetrahydromethanopterin reductase